MNPFNVITTVVGLFTNYATTRVTTNFIGAHIHRSPRRSVLLLQKTAMWTTGLIVGSMIQDRIDAYTKKKVDLYLKKFSAFIKKTTP